MGGTCSLPFIKRRSPGGDYKWDIRYQVLRGFDDALKDAVLVQFVYYNTIDGYYHSFLRKDGGLDSKGRELVGREFAGRSGSGVVRREVYAGSDAFYYVLNSADVEGLDESLDVLNSLVLQTEDIWGKEVLVLANNQGEEGALSPDLIELKIRQRYSFVQGVSLIVKPCDITFRDSDCGVFKFDGLLEAFVYVASQVATRKGLTRFDDHDNNSTAEEENVKSIGVHDNNSTAEEENVKSIGVHDNNSTAEEENVKSIGVSDNNSTAKEIKNIPHQSLNKTFLYQKWNGGTSNFWFDLDAEHPPPKPE